MKSRFCGSARLLTVVLAATVVLPATARGDWHVATVESGGEVGGSPSLAIDAEGNSHVAYVDYTLGCLKYARRVGDVWETQIVDTRMPYYPSLAVDSQGRPHVAWCTPGGLLYSHWTGTQWQTETAVSGGMVGAIVPPALALTTADEPRIAYYINDGTGCWLGYATPAEPAWATTIIAWHGLSGCRPALALDANDNPRIAWAWEWSMGCSLFYYSFDAGVWSNEYVAECGLCASGLAPALALDSSGDAHVFTTLDGVLSHRQRTAAGWQFDIIADDVVNSNAAVLDAFDHPHVAYYRWYADCLKYAHRTTSSWCIQTADDSGPDDVGYTPSIAVDADGIPHIAYRDRTHEDLKYTWWEPTVIVGDLNCDGCVGFGDINLFVLYLANFEAWWASFPNCLPANGDINGDGAYPSFRDINPFVVLLSSMD